MAENIPSKIYKFQSFEYRYSIENLRLGQIWFSKPEGLNDPFDCAIPTNFVGTDNEEEMAKFFTGYYFANLMKEGKPEEITKLTLQHFHHAKPDKVLMKRLERIFQEVSQARIDEYSRMGVACFTTEINNTLMWSHYADGHKGFCLEFDTSHFSFREKLTKVIYDDTFPLLSPLDMISAGHRVNEPLYTKSNDWKHEDEWRFIKREGNTPFKYDPKALTGIYFGCAALKENIDKIAGLASKAAPQLYRMKRSKTEFKLECEPYHS